MSYNGALTRGNNNPVLRNGPETYDETKTGPSCIVKVGPGDYRQWYEGLDTATGSSGETLTLACYATSTDGTNWTKYGSNPVMDGTEAWEDDECSPVSVLYDPDAGYWKMWYHGGNNLGGRSIGYATSSDGISWTKYGGNPIITAVDAWETASGPNSGIADFKVVRRSATEYHGWYRNVVTGKFGYVTSTDGITWAKYAGNPVFQEATAGAWDEYIMAFCPVWDGGWRAWYVARKTDFSSSGIGYAFSPDGINWTRGASNPVLVNTTTDSPQDSIHAYRDGDRYRIVYGQYYLADVPALRGKGEALEAKSARNFNGSSDYIELANSTDVAFERTEAFSAAVWTRRGSGGSGALVTKMGSLANWGGWALAIEANTPRQPLFQLRNTAGNELIRYGGDNLIPEGEWKSVIATYDGSSDVNNVELYVDGVDAGTGTAPDTDSLSSGTTIVAAPAQIGSRELSVSRLFYTGDIAYVAVWSVQLTAAEALQFHNGGTVPRQDKLRVFVRLDEGKSPEPDETTGNPGTLTGTTVVGGPPVIYDALTTYPTVQSDSSRAFALIGSARRTDPQMGLSASPRETRGPAPAGAYERQLVTRMHQYVPTVTEHALVGDIQLDLTVDSSLLQEQFLVGDMAYAPAVDGAATRTTFVVGDIALAPAVDGSVTRVALLSGDITQDYTLDGSVTRTTFLVGDVGLDPTVDGAASRTTSLAGDFTLPLTVDGAIDVLGAIFLDGSIDLTLTVDGAVTRTTFVVGDISLPLTVDGAIDVAGMVTIEGDPTLPLTVDGAVTRTTFLVGDITLDPVVDGGITTVAAGQLAGDITLNLTVDGAATRTTFVVGDIALAPTVDGSITPTYKLAGDIALPFTVDGNIAIAAAVVPATLTITDIIGATVTVQNLTGADVTVSEGNGQVLVTVGDTVP